MLRTFANENESNHNDRYASHHRRQGQQEALHRVITTS